ncbi:hypothetical protein [Klebsiella oxytoca]|uniref:hypothetical protein n=1 Tax=Klebsiella oxytoca TaxID=571 RepID=UPI00115BBE35|nr:hypothetical protein [Klebsiella oxytoca]
MSFTTEMTVRPVKVYHQLLGAAIHGEEEVLKVTYAVTSLVQLTGTTGVAEYTVTPEGAELTGTGSIEFEYSGKGNPLEEAEEALRESLSVQ